MANPIPPLLCSTPPPIDFDEESSANNDGNDDFCEFDTGDTETFDGQSLPSTPRHLIHSVNNKLDSPLATEHKNNTIDVTENKENIFCEDKIESKVLETESAEISVSVDRELEVKVIEKHKNVEESISENSIDEEKTQIEESLEMFTNNLSDCKSCGLDNNEKEVTNSIDTEETLYINSADSELNNKREVIESDDKNTIPFEDNEKSENMLNFKSFGSSHNEINELSASKTEIFKLNSSTEYTNDINESNSDILANSKNFSTDNFSHTTNEVENISNTIHSAVKQDEDKIIANSDEICELNIESKWSEAVNVDKDENNLTFEADFSQFQAFESFETTNIDLNNKTINMDESVIIDNINSEEFQQEQAKETLDDEDEFDNFQNYSSQSIEFPNKNDSNEFTDFKEAAPPPFTENPTISNCLTANFNLQDKIKTILDSMFPVNESDNNSNMDIIVQNDLKTKSINLNSVDSATALNFQWTNSTIKHSLVKSIGIDSRNILHGEKWNSSMPRFAANLGFNPLEPLKPVKLDSIPNTSNFLESEPSTSLGKVVANRIDVPAVEFDWNTSGLVNPLDGVKEVIHERKTETIHTTQSGELQDTFNELSKTENTINDNNSSGSSNSNDTKSIVKLHEDKEPIHTKEYISTFDTNLVIEQSPGPTLIISNNLDNIKNLEQLTYTNYQSSENIDVISTSSSSNPNTFIVPLKETHIFTPSKSDAAISRSTTNISEATTIGKCTPIDFDYEIAAAGTVIDETVIKKEYRDIEYNPSKFILNSLSTNSIQLSENENSLNTEKCEISEETVGNDLSIANGSWDYYNNATESNNSTLGNKNDTNLTKELSIDTHESLNNFQDALSMEKFNNFLKPTIGLSPTEKNEFHKENKEIEDHKIYKDNNLDDEFTEFQFVPPSSTLVKNSSFPIIVNSADITIPQLIPSNSIKLKDKEKLNRINTGDQMILSPAILLPQSVQIHCEPKIDWPEPGIDPEELARIETLFPSKQNNFHNQITSSINHTSNISNENTYTTTINNDDDWSDFISVPVVSVTENNLNTIYCPKSPTKVAKSITTTTDFNNDDEWSDFISSTPSANTMNKADNGSINKNPYSSGTTKTSQQNYKNIVPNQRIMNSNNDQTMINNKICQYLLNNGNIESKNTMHLNSLKTTDFTPQHSFQQEKINLNRNQLSHHKITPNISLIPDLGYVAPQNFISIPKKNLQKK